MAHVDWTWLFVDAPAGRGDRSLVFWSAVTVTTPSTPRGDRGQFVTLRPPCGPAWLKHQRTRDDARGVHVDLDVADPTAVADRAVAMGATVTATVDVDPDSGKPGLVVLRSPGGFPLCLVRSAGDRGPVDRAGDRAGAARLADQVCLDIPPDLVDGEVAFWAALTGWELGSSVVREEFHWLQTPPGHPVRVVAATPRRPWRRGRARPPRHRLPQPDGRNRAPPRPGGPARGRLPVLDGHAGPGRRDVLPHRSGSRDGHAGPAVNVSPATAPSAGRCRSARAGSA